MTSPLNTHHHLIAPSLAGKVGSSKDVRRQTTNIICFLFVYLL